MIHDQDDELSMQVYRKLLRTARNLRRELSATVYEHGLTGSQYAVLEAIPEDGMPLGSLAKHVWKDPSNITGIVDRLEQSGWLTREKSPEDRRIILVLLTEQGKQLCETIRAVHPENVHKRLAILTDDDKLEMLRLLDKLREVKM